MYEQNQNKQNNQSQQNKQNSQNKQNQQNKQDQQNKKKNFVGVFASLGPLSKNWTISLQNLVSVFGMAF